MVDVYRYARTVTSSQACGCGFTGFWFCTNIIFKLYITFDNIFALYGGVTKPNAVHLHLTPLLIDVVFIVILQPFLV
jgi:hypothetical protein